MSSSARPALVVCSRIRVSPDRRQEVVDAALKVSEACSSSPDCVQFTVAADAADASSVVIFELWSDPAALALSFQCEPMTGFQEALRRARTRKVQRQSGFELRPKRRVPPITVEVDLIVQAPTPPP